ncbi:hypothetical protein D0865_09071 [Hortaea werneckii]|uniref:Uncharacterized protein n=1 Tax=Hortaea werneckii TaxID=91943 RepID=A0A3M7C428_HORWE|nr:hypothetical protein D0865_09071 [Hortaea werneckii]
MGIYLSTTATSPFFLTSGIIGFVSFAFTLGTFIRVLWSNFSTLGEAPHEVHTYLTNLRTELLEERANLRVMKKMCKKHHRMISRGDGSRMDSGVELDDVTLKTMGDTVKRLIRQFREIERPFLEPGEHGISDIDEHEKRRRRRKRESRSVSPYYGSANEKDNRSRSRARGYYDRETRRLPRYVVDGYADDEDDPDGDKFWAQRTKYASYSFRKRMQWLYKKPKAQQLFETLSRVQIRRMARQVVASYNWLDSEEPTILVPGAPPLWDPPENPVQIAPDTGTFFIDPNAGILTTSPMEPLLRALLHEHPDFDFSSLDLITDRWALSRLLSDNESWSLAAQVVGGGTIVFIRLEPEREIHIQPHQFRGFRRNFEKEFLEYREDCWGSRAHYQIIMYKLGEIKIMLRHAAAGYLADLTDQSIDTEKSPSMPGDNTTATAQQQQQQHGDLRITPAGHHVPRSAIFELSTSKKISTVEAYKQHEVAEQWIAQTQTYIRALPAQTSRNKQAWKIRGMFSKKESIDVRREAHEDIAEWERENQRRIQRLYRRLSDVMLRLRIACQESKSRYFVLEPEKGKGTIRIRAVGAEEVRGLPRDLTERLVSRVSPTQNRDAEGGEEEENEGDG